MSKSSLEDIIKAYTNENGFSIENYIYVKNHLPIELCKALIDECNKKKWEKHTWYDYGKDKLGSKPEKELEVMPCTEEQQAHIAPHLVKALKEYQIKHTWPGENTQPPWLTKFSPIRFNKYEVGNMMREHYDHIQSIFDGKLKGVPIVSIVANLNDDYEGAAFYCRGKEIPLKTGDILLFPSNFMYPHKVGEATKGTRYSFVCWAF